MNREPVAYVITKEGSSRLVEWETTEIGSQIQVKDYRLILWCKDGIYYDLWDPAAPPQDRTGGRYLLVFTSEEEVRAAYQQVHQRWQKTSDGTRAPRILPVRCHYGYETGQLAFISEIPYG